MAIRWPGICSQILRKSRANWTAFFNREHFFFLRCSLSVFLSLSIVWFDASREKFIIHKILKPFLTTISLQVDHGLDLSLKGNLLELEKRTKERKIESCNTLWIHERFESVTSIDMYIDRGGTCGQSLPTDFQQIKLALNSNVFLVKIPIKIKIRFVLTHQRGEEKERN